jgi:hypothetical protein
MSPVSRLSARWGTEVRRASAAGAPFAASLSWGGYHLRQIDYLVWAQSHGLQQRATVDDAANDSGQSLESANEADIPRNEGRRIN